MPTMPRVDTNPPQWSYVLPDDPDWGDLDVVRLYCQDTNPAVRLLGDLEIQYFIDVWLPKYDSLIFVASVAADTIAAKFAGVTSIDADGVSVKVGDLAAHYAVLAEQLRALHKDAQVGGEVDLAGLMWSQGIDWMIKPLEFGIGMTDNREAGRQSYGSQRDVAVLDDDMVGWF